LTLILRLCGTSSGCGESNFIALSSLSFEFRFSITITADGVTCISMDDLDYDSSHLISILLIVDQDESHLFSISSCWVNELVFISRFSCRVFQSIGVYTRFRRVQLMDLVCFHLSGFSPSLLLSRVALVLRKRPKLVSIRSAQIEIGVTLSHQRMVSLLSCG
jgi:hypothetical protein